MSDDGERGARKLVSAQASVTILQVPARPNVRLLIAEGEFDLSTRDKLCVPLEAAFESNPLVIILDLSRADFVDAACVGALVRAHDRAQHDVVAFRIVAPRALVVTRCFAVTGLDEELFFYPTLAEALVGPLRTPAFDGEAAAEPLVLDEDTP